VAKPAPDYPTYEQAAEATAVIAQHGARAPRVAVILGSGLGGFVDRMKDVVAVPYADIPSFPVSTVSGHAGKLALGAIGGVPVVAMQGRFHFYEGYTPQQVVFPVRVMRLLGAEVLIVTAAAGGLNPALAAGSVMLLNDHIGLPLLAGNNPLRGENDERFGTRFPSTTGAYDQDLAALAREAATQRGVQLYEGVYAMVSGPSFESPAEIRFLRLAGADAVGMSTVPEVIAARHLGMRTMALCCVTNAALADSESGVEPNHAEVLAVAAAAGDDLAAIVEGVITRLGTAAPPPSSA
jgi:purine-nucleoside phosphorylase